MRKPRQLKLNAWYHVTVKANLGEFIFEENEIKAMFEQVMKETQEKYLFKSDNFVIMSNHVHIKIKPSEKVSLSRIMQSMLCKFAKRFNKYFDRKGHVFYDRFHSVIIETKDQAIKVFNYIADNPVRAGLVKNPEEYKFNGITYIIKGFFNLLSPPETYLLVNYFNR